MKTVIVTGSAGLIGSESVEFFIKKGFRVIGIDNDMRGKFFGKEASTKWNTRRLKKAFPDYIYLNIDLRDKKKVEKVFNEYNTDIHLIIHTASQPSHDWAATDPYTDFTINALATVNLLEFTRKYCPEAVFCHCSTNKVYGDNVNKIPLVELETRYSPDPNSPYVNGIDENFSIDHCSHTLYGASKVAADIYVQEYGKYFGLKTASFRFGCLTGPLHSGTELHGFLAYLMKCCITGKEYRIYGYKGKQVRDNIHSYDVVNMFWHFYQNPKRGVVYNAGGGTYSNCSVLEAIQMAEEITGKKMNYVYVDQARKADFIWWVGDIRKWKNDYPEWDFTRSQKDILVEIYDQLSKRL